MGMAAAPGTLQKTPLRASTGKLHWEIRLEWGRTKPPVSPCFNFHYQPQSAVKSITGKYLQSAGNRKKKMFSSGKGFHFLHSSSTSRKTKSNLGASIEQGKTFLQFHKNMKVNSPPLRRTQITGALWQALSSSIFCIPKHSQSLYLKATCQPLLQHWVHTAAELPRWPCLCEPQHAAEGPAPPASQGKCHHSRSQRLSQHTFTHPQTSARGFPLGRCSRSRCAHLTKSCPCINVQEKAPAQRAESSGERHVSACVTGHRDTLQNWFKSLHLFALVSQRP